MAPSKSSRWMNFAAAASRGHQCKQWRPITADNLLRQRPGVFDSPCLSEQSSHASRACKSFGECSRSAKRHSRDTGDHDKPRGNELQLSRIMQVFITAFMRARAQTQQVWGRNTVVASRYEAAHFFFSFSETTCGHCTVRVLFTIKRGAGRIFKGQTISINVSENSELNTAVISSKLSREPGDEHIVNRRGMSIIGLEKEPLHNERQVFLRTVISQGAKSFLERLRLSRKRPSERVLIERNISSRS